MKKWPFLIPLLLLACDYDDSIHFENQEVEGFKPVYVDSEVAFDIKMQEVQPIENAGKLYLYGDLLLINEIGKGIHMIDNSNPSSPVKLGFIKVPGSQDMVIKGNVIYSNNYSDLVALRIDNPEQVTVTERIKNVITTNSLYPTERGFYFECADPSKGVVVGWQKTTITNPQCYR